MVRAKDKGQNIGMQILEPVIEKYVFAKPFKGDEAKAVYEEVMGRVEKDFKNSPVFNNYFQFNEQTGEINGSNTYFEILINKVLIKNDLFLPTIQQAKQLDSLGILSNKVYRDYGIAVYSKDQPNQEVAKRLIQEANKRGQKLPILAPFKALDLIPGAKISFRKDVEGIITGEEARQYLDKEFDYKMDSGVCRLYRNGDGDWNANWNRFDSSDADGRVDFVCGEATTKNLETALLLEIHNSAQKEVESLNTKIASAKGAALQILRG